MRRLLALPRLWVAFFRAVITRFNADQSTVLAGYTAYAAMLAGMPFLIFTVSMAGAIIGAEGSDEAVRALFAAVPGHVARTLEPVLRQVTERDSGGIATLSLLGTVWAASNGVEALRIGLERAYDVETPRDFVTRRVVSIAIVLAGFVTFALLAILIIFAPLIFVLIEAYSPLEIPGVAVIVRYVAGAGVLLAFLWICHRGLPARNMSGFRLMPGILISVVLWGILASAMSIYLSHAPSYTVTYGALAGVIVTLLFFYLTAIAIIFGGQVNAVVNEHLLVTPDPAALSDTASGAD